MEARYKQHTVIPATPKGSDGIRRVRPANSVDAIKVVVSTQTNMRTFWEDWVCVDMRWSPEVGLLKKYGAIFTGGNQQAAWSSPSRLGMTTDVLERWRVLALEDAGIQAQDLEMLINTSVRRDWLEPSTASIFSQNKLVRTSSGFSQLTTKKALSAFLFLSAFWFGAAVFGFLPTFQVHSGLVSKSEHIIVHPQALFKILTVWSNQPS